MIFAFLQLRSLVRNSHLILIQSLRYICHILFPTIQIMLILIQSQFMLIQSVLHLINLSLRYNLEPGVRSYDLLWCR